MRAILFVILIGGTVLPALAGSTKQPVELRVADPTLRMQSEGSIRDTDGDGCWDEISGRTASGASFTHHVVDGQCNGVVGTTLRATLIEGSLESEAYVVALADVKSGRTTGVLIKDAESGDVAYIPGLWTQDKSAHLAAASRIGIQMSVDGEKAIIVVPDNTTGSVNLVQANGSLVPLFSGQLDEGSTTISLPTTVSSGPYILSVVTDSGSQSVAFTLQR